MKIENLISGIIYTEVDDAIGPNPVVWLPSTISEHIRLHVSVKTVAILSAERGIIPKSLIIMPFPSLKIKSMIKYLEWEDKTKRGNVARSVITLLFEELNDVYFYKCLEYFESAFNYSAKSIVKITKTKANQQELVKELENLQTNVIHILTEVQKKENIQCQAFPDKEIQAINWQFKIIVVGDATVGKTSIILRFTDNAFNRNYMVTLGVHVSNKIVKIESSNIQLVLWDIAGQSKFTLMRTAFYQGAKGVLLVFDLTNLESFHSVKNWYNDVKKYVNDEITGFIIGNKNDLFNERKVSSDEARKLAYELNLQYFETSALTGANVKESFDNLAKYLYKISI